MSISGLKRSGIYWSYRQFYSCTNAEGERRTYWGILCPLFFKLVLKSLNRNISSVSTDQLFNKRWEIQGATGKQLQNLLMLAWQNCINSSFGWQHVRDNSQRNFPPVHVWVHRRKLVIVPFCRLSNGQHLTKCVWRGARFRLRNRLAVAATRCMTFILVISLGSQCWRCGKVAEPRTDQTERQAAGTDIPAAAMYTTESTRGYCIANHPLVLCYWGASWYSHMKNLQPPSEASLLMTNPG